MVERRQMVVKASGLDGDALRGSCGTFSMVEELVHSRDR